MDTLNMMKTANGEETTVSTKPVADGAKRDMTTMMTITNLCAKKMMMRKTMRRNVMMINAARKSKRITIHIMDTSNMMKTANGEETTVSTKPVADGAKRDLTTMMTIINLCARKMMTKMMTRINALMIIVAPEKNLTGAIWSMIQNAFGVAENVMEIVDVDGAEIDTLMTTPNLFVESLTTNQ
jgi:hypothetical protein